MTNQQALAFRQVYTHLQERDIENRRLKYALSKTNRRAQRALEEYNEDLQLLVQAYGKEREEGDLVVREEPEADTVNLGGQHVALEDVQAFSEGLQELLEADTDREPYAYVMKGADDWPDDLRMNEVDALMDLGAIEDDE